MNIGYPAICLSLIGEKIFPCRPLDGDPSTFSDTYLKNLEDLQRVLVWNEEHGIKFFRVSNNLAQKNLEKFSNYEKIQEKMKSIGDYCRENNHRLSFHCSHHAVLCSPKGFVRSLARDEIETESKFFDHLGYEPTQWNKINIHVGGAYGNKEATLKEWIKSWEKLSDRAKQRLVVENDDRASLYSVQDLYDGLHKTIGIGVTFDSYHHNFCNRGEEKSEAAAIAASTWKTAAPCFHFASSRTLNETKSSPTAHADWIYEDITDWGTGAWTMVESVGRDLAVLHYLKNGKGIPSVEELQHFSEQQNLRILETVRNHD